MKSKIFVIIGILLITISSIFIIKDKVIEYDAGKKSDEILKQELPKGKTLALKKILKPKKK